MTAVAVEAAAMLPMFQIRNSSGILFGQNRSLLLEARPPQHVNPLHLRNFRNLQERLNLAPGRDVLSFATLERMYSAPYNEDKQRYVIG
jgi:hypothetical protein